MTRDRRRNFANVIADAAVVGAGADGDVAIVANVVGVPADAVVVAGVAIGAGAALQVQVLSSQSPCLSLQ